MQLLANKTSAPARQARSGRKQGRMAVVRPQALAVSTSTSTSTVAGATPFSITLKSKSGMEMSINLPMELMGGDAAAAGPMPSDAEIRGLFGKWNAALATLNPELVADCYATDGVLLPTVSNQVRTNRAAIVDYFKLFLTKKPQGVINESHVSIFNSNLAAHYGIYTFSLTDPATGVVSQVGARFSYTYRKEGDQWKIVEHHSSALPEGKAVASEALPSEAEVRDLFYQWNSALATLNPENVADMYAKDGVLLPTVSNKVRTNRAEIVDYFKAFLQKKPQGVINESYVSIFNGSYAQHTGIYTFTLTNVDGSKVKVPARFSYTYRKEAGKWLIVEHHSSALPEGAMPVPETLPSEAEVRGLFNVWNTALATLDAKKVTELYAKDGILLPTVSNKVRTNHTEIEDYFKMFLTKKPQGVINESHVSIFSSTTAAHYGIYTFSLTDPATGVVSQVGARFSYTYKKVDGKWLIAEHHSSALPETAKVSEAPKEEPKPSFPFNLFGRRSSAPSKDEIRGLFTIWNNALATLNPDNVADCYAKDAVLLPTVSNKVRTNRAEILDYFKMFLTKKPQGVINESHVTIFSDTVAQHTGIYTFTLANPDGTSSKVGARFSYTYRKEGSKWLIVEHHSSALPEGKPVHAETLPSEAAVRAQFDKWNAALQTLNPESVADCYAKDAVLLPTVSNKVRTSRLEILDYFGMFLKRKPFGVINESHVTIHNSTLASHSGIYTFSLFNPADGTTSKVGARFSFTYRKEGENWLITEHHSSALPEPVPVAAAAASAANN